MTTHQTDAVAMTEEQLDTVAGGVMPDENGRPCTAPRRRRWCFPSPRSHSQSLLLTRGR